MVENPTLNNNNKINNTLIKSEESQQYTKYVNIQHYYIKDFVNKKEPIVKQIPSKERIAKNITKKLLIKNF